MITRKKVVVEQRGWHLDRNFPIAIVITLIIQTIGFVSWGASWSTGISRDVQAIAKEQSFMRSDVSDLRGDIKDIQKSITDGSTPTAVNAARLDSLAQQMRTLAAQVEVIRQQRTPH